MISPIGRLCPNCLAQAAIIFYSAEQVPICSLELLDDRETAIGFPRADIHLALCESCGFITNAAFREAATDQQVDASRYEESQAASPTFQNFSKRLASRIVDDHGLRGASVVEIGCGKGGFLVDLVEAGVGRGVGYDPAYVPGRITGQALDRLEFRREMFTEQTPPVDADMICCRHTLEHIPNTHRFLSMIRRNIGDNKDTIVVIEVPDVGRILAEGAFWDIYYEHCSYFNAASLERLLRCTGFAPVETWLDYNDQYLLAVARTAEISNNPPAPSHDLLSRCKSFSEAVDTRIDAFRKRISECLDAGKKVVLWGSGSKSVGYLTSLGKEIADQIDSVVDINPHRQGYYQPGLPQIIVAPTDLVEVRPDLVIVMNPVYVQEIAADLRAMGLDPIIEAI